MTGSLVNGLGSTEKCNNIKIKVYVNSKAKALLYTNEDGVFSMGESAISDIPQDIVDDFSLDANYPNPFNAATSVPFTINNPGKIKLSVYDIRGRKIRTLVQDHFSAGNYAMIWDGINDKMQVCSPGIYFSVLQMNGKTEIKKMTMSASTTISPSSPRTLYLSKALSNTLELKIEDSSIENLSYTQSYSEIPTNLNLGTIPIHVYPFLRTPAENTPVLESSDARDTIDLYFEQDIELKSNDIDFDWTINDDKSITMQYYNVNKESANFSVQELSSTKTITFNIDFDLDLKAKIWPYKLRRAYVGKMYSRTIQTEYSKGDISFTPSKSLPFNFSINDQNLEGSPSASASSMIYFNLSDDRNVSWQDSALLNLSNYNDLSFNDYVVDLLEEYHHDGRYPYSWVSGYTGVTKNLFYLGSQIASAKADSSHSTYCSGITFEIWLRAMKRLQDDMGYSENINDMSVSDISDFRRKWFVLEINGDGPGLALESYGLGTSIDHMKDVKAGDFVQIWRTTTSGHSVIFINWTTNAAGDTTGMRYWSTQKSTNGINYNTEYFPEAGGTISKTNTHYSRGFKPEEFIDF